MIAVRIINWIARIAGIVTLLLGLTFWVTGIDGIPNIHMLFGITFTLAFLILSIIAVFTRGIRLLGVGGIVYALIVPVFGLSQAALLAGDLHWLIRLAHLLVGLGALTLLQTIFTRYERLKQPAQQATSAANAD